MSVRGPTDIRPAREAAACAGKIPDGDALKSRLGQFAPDEAEPAAADPATPTLLALLREVKTWREPAKKGARVFDDKKFFESLDSQYSLRRTLTPRQTAALKRMALAYADRIPDFEARTKDLGLRENPGAADDKSGE